MTRRVDLAKGEVRDDAPERAERAEPADPPFAVAVSAPGRKTSLAWRLSVQLPWNPCDCFSMRRGMSFCLWRSSALLFS